VWEDPQDASPARKNKKKEKEEKKKEKNIPYPLRSG
jgi:hypothetical protein